MLSRNLEMMANTHLQNILWNFFGKSLNIIMKDLL